MLYYLLNINVSKDVGTSQVDEWIQNKKIAPIFYGLTTIDEIRNGTARLNSKPLPPDAKLFVDTFFNNINKNAIVFSIGEENIYFYKQEGALKQYEEIEVKTKNGKKETHLVKGFPIKLLCKKKIWESPLVLATIKANAYMGRGTFKQVDETKEGSYFGNCRAIEYLLGKGPQVSSFKDYLRCLSALEFETLIAKLFEEQRYFVPAYKGGVLKNYDLFCKKGEKVTPLQIKLHLQKKHYDKNKKDLVYYCISSDVSEGKIKTNDVIEKELDNCPKTREWLNQTLYWVKFEK